VSSQVVRYIVAHGVALKAVYLKATSLEVELEGRLHEEELKLFLQQQNKPSHTLQVTENMSPQTERICRKSLQINISRKLLSTNRKDFSRKYYSHKICLHTVFRHKQKRSPQDPGALTMTTICIYAPYISLHT
jgi:predicted SprT family Zn-dependent metalloprotease